MSRTRAGAILVTLYVAFACTAYRFGHPGQSETRLFLNIPAAVVWSW